MVNELKNNAIVLNKSLSAKFLATEKMSLIKKECELLKRKLHKIKLPKAKQEKKIIKQGHKLLFPITFLILNFYKYSNDMKINNIRKIKLKYIRKLKIK